MPEEEMSFQDKRREQNQRNIANNEQAIRVAAKNLKDKGIPYASTIAKGIDIADKVTGGATTRMAAKNVNRLTKMTPQGRIAQKGINALGESGLMTSTNGSGNADDIKLKMPVSKKALVPVLLIGVIAFSLLSGFVVLFSDEGEPGGGGVGTFMYGGTCTTITVTNSDCDGSGENCTNQYDGEVDLETYVAGVVAAESGNANNLEYYKAAAVIARTYVQNNIGSSCTVQGNTNFQEYMDVDSSSYATTIKQGVRETENIVMIQNGSLVNTNWETGNTGWKINQQEALNLINNQNYSYEQVLKYYYGDTIQLTNNEITLSGNNGFVNPTRIINCSSAYGDRDDPTTEEIDTVFHNGLDIAITIGETVYATKSGTVVAVTKNVTQINDCAYGYGNYVKIDHGDGTATVYGHMKYGSIKDKVNVGYKVKQGEQIGAIGSTGCSTGPHLHYEVRKNESTVDPADYLDLTNASGECKR